MTPKVTVVGLGPGDRGLRTVATQKLLDEAERIILRTRIHPGLDDLAADPRVSDCDDLYIRGATFDDVYAAVAERVLAAARALGAVLFAVPGHPRFGERSVALLLERADEAGVAVEVHPAVSVLDVASTAVTLDPLLGLQLLDALDLQAAAEAEPFSGGTAAIDPTLPCLVTQVYDRQVATAVKLRLTRHYPDDHLVWVLKSAGVPTAQEIVRRPLFEIDRHPVDHLTSVLVPALAPLDAVRSPETLQRIAAHLRSAAGCPWDRKQTHGSIRQAVIEEAYETADAIDSGDSDELADELGDLLLQVALHSQIAEEAGEFTLEDVYEKVNRKLVRRHPHVFGDVLAETAGEVVRTWDAVKAAERAAAGKPPKDDTHPVDNLPRSMPALGKARTLLGPRKGDRELAADPRNLDVTGAAILAAVEAAVVAGVDPEQALDRALRARFTPTP